MANSNPPRNARNGRSAPATSSRTGFYAALIAIAVIGLGVILYLMKNPAAATAGPGASAASESIQKTIANAGPPKPYTLGNPSAPVVIEEFADYECPVCGRYATVTEPDVRKRIIEPGLAYYKYYDFPLPQHGNSQFASNAAACADEQGKFWEMHDQLFAGQDAWGLQPDGETQVTDNPKPIFEGYARAIGLNVPQWDKCYDARKYQSRVDASQAEALRRQVNETPTFFVNGSALPPGSGTYDALKKAVDDANAGKAAAANGAASKPAKTP